jgi:hypothetical protein
MPTKEQIRQALLNSAQDMSDVHPFLKAMLYGPSGGGKTVLAVDIAQTITPPDKIILYLDSMEHWVSLQNHPELKKRVRRLKYQGLSQIEEIQSAIKDGFDFFADVGTIVLDELDSMQTEDLDLVAMSSQEKDHGPDDVTWPDFNKNTTRVRRKIRALLKEDVNVICVAHDGEGKDRRGIVVQRPDFTPKLAKVILEFVHLCGYMTADVIKTSDNKNEYKRIVQVHPTGNLITKSRIGGLPYQVDPEQLKAAIVEWMAGEREDVKDDRAERILAGLKVDELPTGAIRVED